MACDTIDNTVVFIGFGDSLLTKINAARDNDNTPDPMASTTVTELKKIIPSKPIGGKAKYLTLICINSGPI